MNTQHSGDNPKPAMKRILPVLVISQVLCTSLWFAGNAIAPEIVQEYQLPPGFPALLTSAVQAGFISGTLLLALLRIADRYSPSHIFFISAILAALVNLGVIIAHIPAGGLLLARYLTGLFLAGIYPVGMKIAADHYKQGLGNALGFLVGALVLGTAFPHLLRSITASLPWKYVVLATSTLSVAGGTAVRLLLKDGPYRQPAQGLRMAALFHSFRSRPFRSAAFGYFGHMWELYAFWAFVPVMLRHYNEAHPQTAINVPLLSFCIIASGSAACVLSGVLSRRYSAERIAVTALALSGLCCLLSPLVLLSGSKMLLTGFLIFWGLVVIADSPMFSTLVARYAAPESRGTALTMATCIGFAITIVSIQLIGTLMAAIGPVYVYTFLGVGPVLGVLALRSRNFRS